MIELSVSGQQVECYYGDIVNDTIKTSVGVVPFEWSTGFAVNDAIAAIENFLAQSGENPPQPIIVQSTGRGWIIDLPSASHPQAEITEIDFVTDKIVFRWIGTEYTGDCAVDFVFTTETTPAEVAGAIVGLLPEA
ncbi:hypothetical protein [Pseudohongiella sp. O18]|uniref:hypothetical protein n=1 Tax=Pseudohongiella sp. O18 TaxID=2904248 RepID=UPI001F457C1A|nr:hypothetical protein [Pseudohongiella sp. O18]